MTKDELILMQQLQMLLGKIDSHTARDQRVSIADKINLMLIRLNNMLSNEKSIFEITAFISNLRVSISLMIDEGNARNLSFLHVLAGKQLDGIQFEIGKDDK